LSFLFIFEVQRVRKFYASAGNADVSLETTSKCNQK